MNGWGRPCSGENTVTVHSNKSAQPPRPHTWGPAPTVSSWTGLLLCTPIDVGFGLWGPTVPDSTYHGASTASGSPVVCLPWPSWGSACGCSARVSPAGGTQGLSLVLGALTPPASPFRHLPFLESPAGAQHSLCTPWGEYFKHRNEQVRRRI